MCHFLRRNNYKDLSCISSLVHLVKFVVYNSCVFTTHSYVSSKPQSALNSFTETEQNRRPGPRYKYSCLKKKVNVVKSNKPNLFD